MANGTVTKAVPSADNSSFTVSILSPSGKDTQTAQARKIILATGLRDILPTTPGLEENWGKGIFWCPWCDGHEHADQSLGLLGTLDNVPSSVREILTLNRDIIAFVNGSDTPQLRATTDTKSPGWETYLQIHNVTVLNSTINGIVRLANGTTGHENASLPSVPEHDLFRVDLADGTSVQRQAFFASFPSEQRSALGQGMGVALYGGRLAADGTVGLATNVPGVYAIGDANSDNVTNVPHALFSGKRTAVYLHGRLIRYHCGASGGGKEANVPWLILGYTVKLAREDEQKELSAAGNDTQISSRDLDTEMHAEARSLWDAMNGNPEDILYAGEFDQ